MSTIKYLFTLLAFFFFHCNSFSQSNQSLHFDGQNDYIALDAAIQFVANKSALSMAGWFNADKLQYGAGMMGFRGNGTGTGGFYILQLGSGALECRLLTTTGLHEVVGPAGTIVANQWQHIALVYNGSTLELFLDGTSIGSSTASGTIISLDKPFAVGKSLEGGFNFVYPGQADEVSLWSKALSATEISDMMDNELIGNEADLELYYKFDQGSPGQNNTAITELVSEVGNGTRNAQLFNLELLGDSSNFVGTLDPFVQAISFPQLVNKATLDADFSVNAVASSGLAVSFEIVSGPATINGTTISLTGSPGTVLVKAKQDGNPSFAPAGEILNSFEVIDVVTNTAKIDLRNPIDGDFYAPQLQAIELAAIIDIDYPNLFDVSQIYFKVDGENISLKDWNNLHYTAWWQPTNYGSHTFEVTAINNYGSSISKSVDFNIVSSVSDLNTDAFVDMWLNLDVFTAEAEAVLPSYVGAFDQINAVLDISCPTGGCDPWDRVSSVEVKGHNGEWYQIIRYLTPYGVACNHSIDLTDFMSLLQGKVTFRGNLGTQGNGFLYSLNLDYRAGTPLYPYSKIDKLWSETYDFGNMANLQPCEVYDFTYESGVSASTLKLVSSGHGWGNNNTGNAAEFHEDTHHIWVGGSATFSQNNWNDCNPNPDACSPQAGTWEFDRAGWCPGSIAQWFDYDMTPHISSSTPVELKYIFDEDYVDLCHPNNPNCVSGTTCPNCDDGFNPHLIVRSHLISFKNSPFNTDTTYTSLNNTSPSSLNVIVYPNPSAGKFIVDISSIENVKSISIYDISGQQISYRDQATIEKNNVFYENQLASGIYLIQVKSDEGVVNRKVVIE